MSRRRLPSIAAALVAVTAFVTVWSVPAAAHGSEDAGLHSGPIAAALFVAGVGVLGASVYLDHARDVDRRLADAGVAVGLVAVLASIAAAWL